MLRFRVYSGELQHVRDLRAVPRLLRDLRGCHAVSHGRVPVSILYLTHDISPKNLPVLLIPRQRFAFMGLDLDS